MKKRMANAAEVDDADPDEEAKVALSPAPSSTRPVITTEEPAIENESDHQHDSVDVRLHWEESVAEGRAKSSLDVK